MHHLCFVCMLFSVEIHPLLDQGQSFGLSVLDSSALVSVMHGACFSHLSIVEYGRTVLIKAPAYVYVNTGLLLVSAYSLNLDGVGNCGCCRSLRIHRPVWGSRGRYTEGSKSRALLWQSRRRRKRFSSCLTSLTWIPRIFVY